MRQWRLPSFFPSCRISPMTSAVTSIGNRDQRGGDVSSMAKCRIFQSFPSREACESGRHIPCDTSIPEERSMKNTQKRSEGTAEELGGKLKKGVGKVIGNEQMEAEGAVKEVKGKAK